MNGGVAVVRESGRVALVNVAWPVLVLPPKFSTEEGHHESEACCSYDIDCLAARWAVDVSMLGACYNAVSRHFVVFRLCQQDKEQSRNKARAVTKDTNFSFYLGYRSTDAGL